MTLRINRLEFLLVPLLVLCLGSGAAVAGQNDGCGVFVDFDGTKETSYDVLYGSWDDERYPAAGQTLDAYVGIFRAGEEALYHPEVHIHTVSFRIGLTPGSLELIDFESMTGDLLLGTWEEGIHIPGEGPELCSEGEVVYLLRFSVRYTGIPGDITLEDSLYYPRFVIDCTVWPDYPLVDFYCIASHAGVGKSPIPAEDACFMSNPVSHRTWGCIKAL